MQTIRRALAWLGRLHRRKGFGIQSPWAYRLVRSVVEQRQTYYAYRRLDAAARPLTKTSRKLGRLYFRLANRLQPRRIVDYAAPTSAYRDYMLAGCQKAEAVAIDASTGKAEMERRLGQEPLQMARMTTEGDYRLFFQLASERAGEGALIIVEGINNGAEQRRFWREVVADERCTATFDLYHCGLAFFRQKRHKQHYIINF